MNNHKKADCYLINCDWMENYKTLFFYDDLVKNLEKFDEKNKPSNIIQSLDQKYLNKINTFMENKIDINPPFVPLEDKSNNYIKKFVIIDTKIYDLMKKYEIIKDNLIKHSFYVTEKFISVYYKNEKSKVKIYQILLSSLNEKNE